MIGGRRTTRPESRQSTRSLHCSGSTTTTSTMPHFLTPLSSARSRSCGWSPSPIIRSSRFSWAPGTLWRPVNTCRRCIACIAAVRTVPPLTACHRRGRPIARPATRPRHDARRPGRTRQSISPAPPATGFSCRPIANTRHGRCSGTSTNVSVPALSAERRWKCLRHQRWSEPPQSPSHWSSRKRRWPNCGVKRGCETDRRRLDEGQSTVVPDAARLRAVTLRCVPDIRNGSPLASHSTTNPRSRTRIQLPSRWRRRISHS